jgi:hypothetical protein
MRQDQVDVEVERLLKAHDGWGGVGHSQRALERIDGLLLHTRHRLKTSHEAPPVLLVSIRNTTSKWRKQMSIGQARLKGIAT